MRAVEHDEIGTTADPEPVAGKSQGLGTVDRHHVEYLLYPVGVGELTGVG